MMGGGCVGSVMCVPMKCDRRWLCGQCDVCAYEEVVVRAVWCVCL